MHDFSGSTPEIFRSHRILPSSGEWYLEYTILHGQWIRIKCNIGTDMDLFSEYSQIERTEFDGVEVIIFDPIKHESNRPAIVHFHGGGWVYYNPSN